jgi:hypothetical protein
MPPGQTGLSATWKAIAAFGALSFACRVLQPLFYPDIWWQTREGLGYLANGYGGIPEPLAFGEIAPRLVHEYAGYEAVLALLHQGGGWWAVLAFQILVAFGTLLSLAAFWMTQPGRRPYWVAGLGLIVMLAVLPERFQTRPETLAMVFQLAVILALLRADQMPRTILLGLLAFISLLWTNTHSSFVFLVFLGGLWSVEHLIRAILCRELTPAKTGFSVLIIALPGLAACIHPVGWPRLFLPFTHQTHEWAILLADEMHRPPLAIAFSLGAVQFLVILVTVSRLGRATPVWLMVFSVTALMLTAQHYRFIGVWSVSALANFALLLLSPSRTPAPEPQWSAALVWVFAVGATAQAIATFPIGQRWPIEDQWMGGDGLRWILRQEPGKKVAVLTDMCAGAYASKIEFGGKAESLIDTGLARFDRDTLRAYYYLHYVPEAFEMALSHLNVDYVLIYGRNAQLASIVNVHPDWELAHYERGQFVYARKGRAGLDGTTLVEPFDQAHLPFFYDLHRTAPHQSLTMWLKHPDLIMDERNFPYLWHWLTSLPPSTLETMEKSIPREADARIGDLLSFARTRKSPPAHAWGEKVWIAAFIALENGDSIAAWSLIRNYAPPNHQSPIQEAARLHVHLPQSPFQRQLIWDARNKAWFRTMLDRLNLKIEAHGK